jgi:hypothetical protein
LQRLAASSAVTSLAHVVIPGTAARPGGLRKRAGHD